MNKLTELHRHELCGKNLQQQINLIGELEYNEGLLKLKQTEPNNSTVQYFQISELTEIVTNLKDQINELEKEYKRLLG